jgi:hypothetical protein
MRTAIIILGGLIAWGLPCVCSANGGHSSVTMGTAIKVFIAIWFVVAAVNLWISVSKAGYSFTESCRSSTIFFLPAAAAALIY